MLATAPAHLWGQDEQPSRYAREPGDLESAAEALFGDEWKSITFIAPREQSRRDGDVPDRPGGGTVFNAGVTDWADGLGDPAVERITRAMFSTASRARVHRMRWDAFAQAAPRIAAMAEERFRKDELVMLGTIRPDGSPTDQPERAATSRPGACSSA